MARQKKQSGGKQADALSSAVERLAEQVVMAEADDSAALAETVPLLDALKRAARNTTLAPAASAMADYVNERLEQDPPDTVGTFAVLSDAVAACQRVVHDRKTPAEAGFPDALQLGVTTPRDEPDTAATDAPDAPVIDDPALVAGFVTEGREHLDAAESQLLVLEKDSSNVEALNAVFRAFHTIKGVAAFLGLEAIRTLAHSTENLLDTARRGDTRLGPDDIALVLEAGDALRDMLDDVAGALESGGTAQLANAPERLLQSLAAATSGSPVDGTSDVGSVATERTTAQSVGPEAESSTEGTAHVRVRETVRIDAERLDRLLDTIGELVIAESMVSQSLEVRQQASAVLERQLSRLDKITRELQETSTSLRMVPVRATFKKMTRLVRDLAHRFDKRVELVTSGEDTELDKTVVDLLGDPLVHMLRNTVDHGIEAPAERLKAGKPEEGSIYLRAYHRGGSICIEVEDDGRGLDMRAILARAREAQLIGADDRPTHGELCALIFRPGFSTARELTDVSGRGVGLDVVKRNIESLRGRVDVRSEPGEGTCFTIRLPLTLAIIDGLIVQVGEEQYIMPTLNVIRAVRPGRGGIKTMLEHGEMLEHQGSMIPLFRLGTLFDVGGRHGDDTNRVAVVAEDEGKTVALLVDDLVGKQQFVIKSLGDAMGKTPGVAGCAVMPDGAVGLILSVAGVMHMALRGVSEPTARAITAMAEESTDRVADGVN
ncbi:MAG: chemotaxis protein CheA [Chitinivibrionales bacterium]|nr:chemotaxis protein CheA [Chitinivibrionales bacterium]